VTQHRCWAGATYHVLLVCPWHTIESHKIQGCSTIGWHKMRCSKIAWHKIQRHNIQWHNIQRHKIAWHKIQRHSHTSEGAKSTAYGIMTFSQKMSEYSIYAMTRDITTWLPALLWLVTWLVAALDYVGAQDCVMVSCVMVSWDGLLAYCTHAAMWRCLSHWRCLSPDWVIVWHDA